MRKGVNTGPGPAGAGPTDTGASMGNEGEEVTPTDTEVYPVQVEMPLFALGMVGPMVGLPVMVPTGWGRAR